MITAFGTSVKNQNSKQKICRTLLSLKKCFWISFRNYSWNCPNFLVWHFLHRTNISYWLSISRQFSDHWTNFTDPSSTTVLSILSTKTQLNLQTLEIRWLTDPQKGIKWHQVTLMLLLSFCRLVGSSLSPLSNEDYELRSGQGRQ